MNTPPTHINLKNNAVPHTCHVSIPILHHWNKQVKASLDGEIEKGIISQVPIGSPSTKYSQMIVVPKKDGSTCQTVDLQHLNSHCLRKTYHCPSPLQLASQIPANTFKTVLEAVDGIMLFHWIRRANHWQHLSQNRADVCIMGCLRDF